MQNNSNIIFVDLNGSHIFFSCVSVYGFAPSLPTTALFHINSTDSFNSTGEIEEAAAAAPPEGSRKIVGKSYPTEKKFTGFTDKHTPTITTYNPSLTARLRGDNVTHQRLNYSSVDLYRKSVIKML